MKKILFISIFIISIFGTQTICYCNDYYKKGLDYFNGTNVTKDYYKASEFFRKSCNNNDVNG